MYPFVSIIVPCYKEESAIRLDIHSMSNTLRWRQALSLLFVFFLFALIVLSLFISSARYILAAQLLGYFFVLTLGGLKLSIEKNSGFLLPGLPHAISTMYMAWGAGFLWSGISGPFKKHG